MLYEHNNKVFYMQGCRFMGQGYTRLPGIDIPPLVLPSPIHTNLDILKVSQGFYQI